MTSINFKPSDDFFRVYLNTSWRDKNSSIDNPKWTIKNYQDKYKFYKRCIMVVEQLDWVNQNPAQKTLYVRKTGDLQSNSYDSSKMGLSNIVYAFRSQSAGTAMVNNTLYHQGFPCQTYDPFSQIGFQITSQPTGTAQEQNYTVVTPNNNWGIILTYHFYKE